MSLRDQSTLMCIVGVVAMSVVMLAGCQAAPAAVDYEIKNQRHMAHTHAGYMSYRQFVMNDKATLNQGVKK